MNSSNDDPKKKAPKPNSESPHAPTPSDFSTLNLESDLGILADAGIDSDDSWDLLISSGQGGVGPLGSGK